ncbi:MAG: ABC transporter permease, partial [Acidobacteria bacterium]|nr:ABC transporter permease [Acidobacteriota bacterium]
VSGNIEGAPQAEFVKRELVSANYFSTLGVNAVLGRTLGPGDESKDTNQLVAVISHAFWQRRFAKDPSILGRVIYINNLPRVIIGVSQAGFFGIEVGNSTDMWIPVQSFVSASRLNNRSGGWLNLMARLKPGITLDQARSNIDLLFQQFNSEVISLSSGMPESVKQEIRTRRVEILPVSTGISSLRKTFSRPLFVMMAIAGLVYIIACINVATLIMVRTTARRREIGMRLAIGASRASLLRHFMIESLLLAVLGGTFGLLMASWVSRIIVLLVSKPGDPILLDTSLDLRSVGFTMIVSALTVVILGANPLIQAMRINTASVLKENARGITQSRFQLMSSRILVVLQIAIAMPLVISAGLFFRSIRALENLDLGFNKQNVWMLQVRPMSEGLNLPQISGMYSELLDRINSIPGVSVASLSDLPLVKGGERSATILLSEHTSQPVKDIDIQLLQVGPKFFQLMDTPIIQGRDFTSFDNESAAKVAIVNEAMARHFFQKKSPLGERISLAGMQPSASIEIIGVVKDSRYNDLRNPPPPILYLPLFQHAKTTEKSWITIAARSVNNVSGVPEAVLSELRSAQWRLQYTELSSLSSKLGEFLSSDRLLSRLATIFSLLAIALASVGLYGILSYSVSMRTNEIGIRMALGAERRNIFLLVMRESFTLVFIGLGIGLVLATAASRLISSNLFGVTTADPLTLLLSTLVIVAVGMIAGYIPAWRASIVDPIITLRYE